MSLLLGIDLGTSYFKVGLFDETGTLRGLGRVKVPKAKPAPGRCEMSVDVFWSALRMGLAEALAQSGGSARDIVAMSYSSQASTFVLLDRNDVPQTLLIVWLDARGEPVEAADAGFANSKEFQERIGFSGLSGQSATAKWRWFQRNDPKLWRRAARVMTISDYFTFALTGERAGDASTAAFLGLYDLTEKNWWPAALDHFGVDATRLSRPMLPGTRVSDTISRAGRLLGLRAGIRFAVGGLDHHVAAIGSGVGVLGEVSISTGTVLAALALVDNVAPQPGRFHGPHATGRQYYRLAFDANGAGCLEEYRRQNAPELSVEALVAAAAAPAGTAGHGGQVRAMLEDMAARHRKLVMQTTDLRRVSDVVATGGGSRSPLLLQLDADVLKRRVRTTACAERACLGAAMFAAVAARRHRSLDEAGRAMVQPGAVFEPQSLRRR